MMNFNMNTTVVADNKVSFCGIEYLITDDEALKLKSILDGMVSSRSQSVVNTPVATPVTTVVEKKPYVATKDFQCKFEIKEQTSKDGQKLFCISRSNGWTKAEKALANQAIKAIKGIKEIEVEYTDKNGKNRTFKAWGFAQKSTAQKHLASLPTVITVEQLNSYGK